MSEAVLQAEPRQDDAMAAARRTGVVWLAYATAARHLIRLAAPAVLVFLPIALPAMLGLVLVVEESAALVNGSFELLGVPARPLLMWTAATMLASLAGQVVVMPATVVLAAGLLTGRPVATSAAMRTAVRRVPAMLGLTLLGATVFALITAAGFGMLTLTDQLLGAFLVMTPLALLAMPCLMAVPAVVLEGRSAWRAIVRAYGLLSRDFWPSVWTLAFGVVLFPAAAQHAAQWAAAGRPLAAGVATSVLGLVAPAFQATVIARLFLHHLAHHSTRAETEQVVAALPPSGPGPARPVTVLVGLLLPGLLYGGTMLLNPFGWLEVTQTAVTASWSRDEPPLQDDGRPRPGLHADDLQSVHAGPGSRMVMLVDDRAPARLLICADTACTHTRFIWAEPPRADEDRDIVLPDDPVSSGVLLPDGRFVLSTWSMEGKDHDDARARLGLTMCDAAGCVPAPGGRPIGAWLPASDERNVALAPGRYGGLLIAQLRELPERDGEEDRAVISVTTCDDAACPDPRTTVLAEIPTSTDVSQDHGLAVAAARLNRPVVLRYDERTGTIYVITFEIADCSRFHVERPVHGGVTWRDDDFGERPGATMAVRDDGRPLIAYRDVADGSIRLLDCRNLRCSQADTAILSAPGHDHVVPALALDQQGRALVAYQDLDRDQLVIATCTGTRCTHTPVAKSPRGFGPSLAMTLDGHGRPVIAWIEGSRWSEWHLVVTTPLNLP
ncbi:hypothetical protein [Nonomuraea sp. SYSU D8015]|uniref:hypothetical protein n=1 Tax=Nonomuraea sp. SYSU D8015 TaxID=2593644 RepID=UPI001660E561|nr:hypothetical protein [Nonomuraea sp. SYSU D8015]